MVSLRMATEYGVGGTSDDDVDDGNGEGDCDRENGVFIGHLQNGEAVDYTERSTEYE